MVSLGVFFCNLYPSHSKSDKNEVPLHTGVNLLR
jgi:hypothetical protein